jgi:hypothetical protein
LKDRKTSPNTISLDFDIIPMRREEGISIANLEKLLESERFKGVKNKNQLTIPVISPEEVEFFRLQERERYKCPHRPFIYFNPDGTTSIVGPVVKKNKNGASNSLNNKPRDHP